MYIVALNRPKSSCNQKWVIRLARVLVFVVANKKQIRREELEVANKKIINYTTIT